MPKADYDVIYRDKPVGRIWRFIYPGFPGIGTFVARAARTSGAMPTLHEAMELFRNAWDTLQPDKETA